MPFTLPTFNLTANIWHYATWFGNFPTVIPAPDATTLCNLAVGRRVSGSTNIDMWLLMPIGTDIRDKQKAPTASPQPDIVEVPAGSGRYYMVQTVDDAGKGFANEHRVATINGDVAAFPVLPEWPEPYP